MGVGLCVGILDDSHHHVVQDLGVGRGRGEGAEFRGVERPVTPMSLARADKQAQGTLSLCYAVNAVLPAPPSHISSVLPEPLPSPRLFARI